MCSKFTFRLLLQCMKLKFFTKAENLKSLKSLENFFSVSIFFAMSHDDLMNGGDSLSNGSEKVREEIENSEKVCVNLKLTSFLTIAQQCESDRNLQ
jgi:hypothetical protein